MIKICFDEKKYTRRDELDPLPYTCEWPSLRSVTGRVDVQSLAAFWVNQGKISGPYMEFGVGSGRSAISAIRASRLYGLPAATDFFLFDSFQGLPKLFGNDKDSKQFNEGDFCFTKIMVESKLNEYGVFDKQHVHFVEGFFSKSLKEFDLTYYGFDKVSILHIDVDLYESCKVVLDSIIPYLQQGTIILFDDWNCFNASYKKGERAAVKEWLNNNQYITLSDFVSYGWHGKGFIVDI